MASIVRWEPFNDLVTLRDAMDRLFEESVIRPRGMLAGAGESLAVDVFQTKDNVVVEAAMPGLKAEEIDVSVIGDTLTIKGEFKKESKVEEENYVRRERRFGSFCRQVALPTTVDANKATAEFEDGILKLSLPKVEAVKPKTIAIKAKN